MATVAASALAIIGACDDPTAIRYPPVERRLMLMMDLDPGFETQALYVLSFDRDSIHGLSAELWSGGSLVASAVLNEYDDPCQARLNLTLWAPTGAPIPRYCLVFDYRPMYSVSYEVIVRSQDRPTARARTMIPGDFEIISATAEGDPPGTDRLEAVWTESRGAHRYIIMVRDLTNTPYSPPQGLPFAAHGWMLPTTDTSVATVIPRDEIFPSKPESEFVVSVYSLDRAMYDHMTSGTQDELFPVPPASNVINGFGVVGSWIRRNVPIEHPGG